MPFLIMLADVFTQMKSRSIFILISHNQKTFSQYEELKYVLFSDHGNHDIIFPPFFLFLLGCSKLI